MSQNRIALRNIRIRIQHVEQDGVKQDGGQCLKMATVAIMAAMYTGGRERVLAPPKKSFASGEQFLQVQIPLKQ